MLIVIDKTKNLKHKKVLLETIYYLESLPF
jgi:hypothetical protein